MKFQNPSMHSFWCTDARMDNQKPICSRNFFEVVGIKMYSKDTDGMENSVDSDQTAPIVWSGSTLFA